MKTLFLMLALLQWGGGACGPVGPMDRYEWHPSTIRPGAYALMLNGRQVGFYDPKEGVYQRWVDPVRNAWAEEPCPVPLPEPPKMPGKPKPKEELIAQNFGVDLDKTRCDHAGGCFRFQGERITKAEAMELVGADLPDYSGKLRVMVVGSDAERKAFVDQTKGITADCIVQDCDASHWWATTGGYTPGVWIVKPQTATFGQPVWHQKDYDVQAFADGLQSVRQPQPIDPNRIPGPHTPKPKPDAPGGFSQGEILMAAGVGLLLLFALMHKGNANA